jgi:serine phosphatase RsbU (regulator of sigma subunit)
VLGIDQGPGMADIDRCMRDGFSTGGTAGTGLGAVARLSSTFDIYSMPAQGTVLMSRTAMPSSAPRKATVQLGAICVAVDGEIECGDNWCVVDGATGVSMLIADGLGHGAGAATASKAAVRAFLSGPLETPSKVMTTLHGVVSGTRGAAAACALLHPDAATIDYAGVGNICGCVVIDGKQRGMASHNGTLGLKLPRTQQFEYRWPPDSCVVMHSDGLSARWNLGMYPGLVRHHPATIAGVLYRDFARKRDDATVVVVRRQT